MTSGGVFAIGETVGTHQLASSALVVNDLETGMQKTQVVSTMVTTTFTPLDQSSEVAEGVERCVITELPMEGATGNNPVV